MTYRVGNHQPRNLYRGDQYIGICFDPADTQLIVDAMEGHTPDVDYERGAREALAEVRRRLDITAKPDERLFAATIHKILEHAAAELGLDEEAPLGVEPHIETVSAATIASVMAIVDAPYQPGLDVLLEDDDEDAPSGPPSAPVSAQQPQTQGAPSTEGAETITAPPESIEAARERLHGPHCDGTCREHPGANCPAVMP